MPIHHTGGMGKLRQIRDIDSIVIHCSATKNGEWKTAKDIDEWHRKRHFKRDMSIAPYHAPELKHIGYHFVIYTTGAVQVGRPIEETGAHVAGHNARTIGVCLIGTDMFTRDAWDSLKGLVDSLQAQYSLLGSIKGHRDLSPDKNNDGVITPDEFIKRCPGFPVDQWLKIGKQPVAGHLLLEE